MGLVSGGGGCLANGVYKSYALEPLVVGQLDFADKVVKMPDHAAHDEARPVWHIGSNGVDDSISEVGVETVGAILLHIGRLLCVWVHLGCVKTVYQVMSSVKCCVVRCHLGHEGVY